MLTPPAIHNSHTVLHMRHIIQNTHIQTDHIKHVWFKFQTFQQLCSFHNESNTFSHWHIHTFQQRKRYKENWIVFQLLQEETKAQMLKNVYSTVWHTFGMHSNRSAYRSCTQGLCRIIASASPMHLNMWFKTHIPKENTIFIHSHIYFYCWYVVSVQWHFFLCGMYFTMMKYQELWQMWTFWQLRFELYHKHSTI